MKVSVVGLGIMGAAMAKQLIAGQHQVRVYNRTKAKAEELLSLGAEWADSPAEAASGADIVISMVTDPAAAREVSLGVNGILSGLSAQGLHAEMSTISPSAAEEISQAYSAAQRRYVQAPVLGSRKQIEDKTLLVLAGGVEADIDICRAAWDSFAKKVWSFPAPREASAMKLACNMMIAQMILALGQSMTFAKSFGIPPAQLLDILSMSALASPMYASKGKSIVDGNFAPNFIVSNLLKDVNLAADVAHENGWPAPLNSLAKQIFSEAVNAGYGNEDYSAVVKVISEQAGVVLHSE